VQLTEHAHRAHDLFREQPDQTRDDARELRVAIRKVVWTVKFLQEEPRRRTVPGLPKQVAVGGGEACMLEPLDLNHAPTKRRVRRTPGTLGGHHMQVLQDLPSIFIHVDSVPRKERGLPLGLVAWL
jgi:hypothetical protein